MKKFYFDIKYSRKDWHTSDQWVKEKVLQNGFAVVEAAFMYYWELDWAKKYNTRWYRSKEKKGGKNPFGSYMLVIGILGSFNVLRTEEKILESSS